MALSEKNKLAILNGSLFYKNKFVAGSILIENDKIKKVIIGRKKIKNIKEYKAIDADGCLVSYGFIDPHVHFRTPGFEYKEDWITGSKAAVKGGYTFVIDMPNTNPPATEVQILAQKYEKAKKDSIVNFGFYIGLTDENAEQIIKINKILKRKKIPVFGVKAFLGSSTGSLLILKDKSIYNSLNSSIINLFHAEDENVLKKYESIPYNSIYDHEKKRPVLASVSGIERIIRQAKKIKKKAKIYICHVSSRDEVEIIKKYRRLGFKIIAEITPHHLFFSIDNIKNSGIYKVNPPLRSASHVKALRQETNSGFFQLIGTDHAPHLKKEKLGAKPASGFPGLETSFYVLYDLYKRNLLSLEMIFKLLTSGYKIFNIKKRGKLKKGYFADIIVIKKEKFKFNEKKSFSKSKISPYDGLKSEYKVDKVLINGKIVFKN